MTNDTLRAREFWIREDGGIVRSEDQGIHVIEYSAYESLWVDRDSIYDGYHELRKERDAALQDCRDLGRDMASIEIERDDYRAALEKARATIFAINGSVDIDVHEVLAKYPKEGG